MLQFAKTCIGTVIKFSECCEFIVVKLALLFIHQVHLRQNFSCEQSTGSSLSAATMILQLTLIQTSEYLPHLWLILLHISKHDTSECLQMLISTHI